MKTTEIEWCDSTHNLQMGCDGCELWNPKAGVQHCYAGTLHTRWAGKNKGWPAAFDQPKLFLHRLKEMLRWSDLTGTERPDKPWLNGLPRMIFLNDLGDTFTESLPLDWLAPILPALADSPHQFMILTKRGLRMRAFSQQHPFPTNVWPGVSVTSAANASRVDELLQVCGGGPKWISFEPMLGPIEHLGRNALEGISLAIFGGESGPDARECNVADIRLGLRQCEASGVAAFVKQLGRKPRWRERDISFGWHERFSDPKGGDMQQWPFDLRVRQMPRLRRVSV